MAEVQLLLLGPEEVGKTLMLKRLQTVTAQHNLAQAQQKEDLGEAPSTIPTVGVNLVTLTHNKRKYTFRELGGAMGPIWNNYFKESRNLVYVMDSARPTQIASSCIQFLEVLSSKETQDMPVLLILNKIDIGGCMSRSEISNLIRLPDILACARQDITVLECSFREGTGLRGILKWLHEKSSYVSK
ncbi:ADP-ribosylation factor-like protein 16 [Montipora capricornis]|uniref:ADP-ribosylation factor-like protein 16 n=1 Tax=Montipora capricornis TaxID=246305 RepID=UPI0035F1C150